MALTDIFEQHLAGTRRTPHACPGAWRLYFPFGNLAPSVQRCGANTNTRYSRIFRRALFLSGIQVGWRVYKKACTEDEQVANENL